MKYKYSYLHLASTAVPITWRKAVKNNTHYTQMIPKSYWDVQKVSFSLIQLPNSSGWSQIVLSVSFNFRRTRARCCWSTLKPGWGCEPALRGTGWQELPRNGCQPCPPAFPEPTLVSGGAAAALWLCVTWRTLVFDHKATSLLFGLQNPNGHAYLNRI